MCKRITEIVRTLRTKRDMSLNEIRLTLAIEDPVAKERREYLELTVRPCCCQAAGVHSWRLSLCLACRMQQGPHGTRSRQRSPQLRPAGYPRTG